MDRQRECMVIREGNPRLSHCNRSRMWYSIFKTTTVGKNTIAIIGQSLPCTHTRTTEANAMVLPEQVPGYKSSEVQLLPSSTTKHKVWELYQESAMEKSYETCGLLHLHWVVEATLAIRRRDEAHD